MNNRAKKVLSIVLVIAICISTVISCFITVNATSTNATYTITADVKDTSATSQQHKHLFSMRKHYSAEQLYDNI